MTFVHLARSLSLALALSASPQRAAAEPAAKPASPPTATDALSQQEREMLSVAQDFARRCGDLLERWVASGEVSLEKLSSSLYYPQPRTDPPKFTTDWDRLADRDLLAVEEAVLARSPLMTYAVLTDRNGYVPAHNQRYAQPLTGNLAVDLVNNRTKRIFGDSVGLTAARSDAPFLVQRYERDTGELMVDLSVPVLLRGKHWGSVRLGFRALDDGSRANR